MMKSGGSFTSGLMFFAVLHSYRMGSYSYKILGALFGVLYVAMIRVIIIIALNVKSGPYLAYVFIVLT